MNTDKGEIKEATGLLGFGIIFLTVGLIVGILETIIVTVNIRIVVSIFLIAFGAAAIAFSFEKALKLLKEIK